MLAPDRLAGDVRHALRRLRRDWRFTTAAVLILGVAIGANTAIFSLVNAVLFREQAVADPARLVNIYQNDRAGRPLIVSSYASYSAIAEHTDLFATTMAATVPMPVRYSLDGAIRGATIEYATASYADTLGIRPSIGRWFDATEDRAGAPLVAVLGYRTWARDFGADPAVLGRVVNIDGVRATIVGVGPAGHRGTVDVGVGTDFWLPITALPETEIPGMPGARTIIAPLLVKARLRDGVTVARAQAAMDVLARRLEAEFPEQFRREGEFAIGTGITVVPAAQVRVHPQADAALAALASLVLVIVGLVLAIAASNLATLLLVRGAVRARDISVRLAIGATRPALVRHLLTESVLLALAGGAFGCVIAWWSMGVLQRVDLPITIDLTLDFRVLGFAVALSLVTGVAFGLAPALRATRSDLAAALRDEGLQPIDPRRLTLKNALIVFQVAISVLLLGGTSVFLQAAAAARDLEVGYAVDGVAMLETDARFSNYQQDRARTLYEELLRRIEAIPGVEAAALLRGRPMQPVGVAIVVDGAADEDAAAVPAAALEAGPRFFETLRIPVLYGRVFDARDRADTPRVAVISERFAREHFGEPNAVGRRFRSANDPTSWTEVIGVVRDVGTGDFADDVLDPIAPVFYTSYTQSDATPTTVIARTSGDAEALVAAMQRELRALDVTLPTITAQTMARALEASQAEPRAISAFLGVLGGLGLALASIGLYAVVAFAVTTRAREIGIRMALGARTRQVVWPIARGVAGLVGAGTAAGLFLTVVLMLALRASPSATSIGIGEISVYRPDIDPLALVAIAAVTALVGVAAAFVPSRRAARMDPLAALRHQ
ncbi:MAG TPA: ABC transporter permease [Gammaproteobacteria bacterium]